jgi:hypothetical protein
MTVDELKTLWRFWNVGGRWFGRRSTGEEVKAGTRHAALQKAEWFEQCNH